MGEDEIKQELRSLKETVNRMDKTLNGDTEQQGMRTRIALMEQWVKTANKLVWLLASTALVTLGSALLALVQALL